VHPAALVACARTELVERLPEAERAVTIAISGAITKPSLELDQQLARALDAPPDVSGLIRLLPGSTGLGVCA
jgi:hypothetical protein